MDERSDKNVDRIAVRIVFDSRAIKKRFLASAALIKIGPVGRRFPLCSATLFYGWVLISNEAITFPGKVSRNSR
jgi:hypothetical protein